MSINTAFDNVGRLASLTYPDASGAISAMSETVNYGYDSSGALTSVSGFTPYIMQVAYNANLSPTALTYGNGTTAQYTYDPQQQWLLSASMLTYSYYLGPTLIARRSSSTIWYHSDHLGSARLLADAQGNVKQRYDYTSFGTTVSPANTPLDEFGFTGQRRNPSTATPDGDPAGLIYMNARYYDATLGRFISPNTMIPDPGNPQSLNRYSYVENNPISFRDPTGHEIMRNFDPEDMSRYRHVGLGRNSSLQASLICLSQAVSTEAMAPVTHHPWPLSNSRAITQ